MRQHEPVVQRRAPAHQLLPVRLLPEHGDQRAHQQLLRQAHARMRRHLERAELDEAKPSRRPVRRIELVDADLGAVRVARHVDQQVAEQPVHQPRRHRPVGGIGNLRQRDLQLVERLVTRFVDARRLARRADEQSREQVGQRRMVLPIGDDRREQIRPAQERAVRRRQPAHHDVIAAARAGMPAVQHELLGNQPRRFRIFIERRRVGDDLVPARRRLHVHFDDARIGRHAQHLEARIIRRPIAFHVHRNLGRARGVLDRGDQAPRSRRRSRAAA